jgi:hypothetical protein
LFNLLKYSCSTATGRSNAAASVTCMKQVTRRSLGDI